MAMRIFLALMCICLAVPACAAERSESEAYQDLYFGLISAMAGPGDADFAACPPEAQALYIAAVFDMQVQCGGLSTFFMNEGPEAALLVADSLRMVGLPAMADLYEGFLAEHGIDPAQLEDFVCETQADMQRVYGEYAFLDEFDREYMALWEEESFMARMLEFAAKHPAVQDML